MHIEIKVNKNHVDTNNVSYEEYLNRRNNMCNLTKICVEDNDTDNTNVNHINKKTYICPAAFTSNQKNNRNSSRMVSKNYNIFRRNKR